MIVPLLTESLAEALPFPGPGESSYYCTERAGRAQKGGERPVQGFGVRVNRASKSYVLRCPGWVYIIAPFGSIPVTEARTRARRKFSEHLEVKRDGVPPVQERTLLDLFRKHMEGVEARLRAGEIRSSTAIGYQHLWGKHFERWEDEPLEKITVERLHRWKTEMADRPVAFNRALQQLSAAFNLALRLKWCTENPCAAVERYGERPATRMLSPEEIVAWRDALWVLDGEDRLSNQEVAALLALFYSGARPGEILQASTYNTELSKEGILRINLQRAKGDRKNGQRGRVVRVPPPAGEVLANLRAILHGPLLPDVTPKSLRRAFDKVCKYAGIKDATPKILRHVWRSIAPEAGVDKEHLRQLGGWKSHKIPDSVYVHERDEALDQGALRIAARLEEVSQK